VLKWSPDEVQLLENYFGKVSLKKISDMLESRTYNAVMSKAKRLGLKTNGKPVRYKHPNGYIVVRCNEYPDHLRGIRHRHSRSKYVYEHYVVWWKHNPEDPVTKQHLIHHVDGDKTNNNIGNLQRIFFWNHITVGDNRYGEMETTPETTENFI
jgi:hypothetical protein